MSIKIHHGPPGSYKTSGAIADDLIPALKAGRTIVTNIRGLTRERVFEAFPEVNDIEIISLDTTLQSERDKLANWFHWVPLGAMIFLDEAQSLWPRYWKDADLRALDFPGGTAKAKEAGRPARWEDAFDMHRHFNWDMVLTTPDISKIRPDIRGVAEGAFKHRNLGMVTSLLKGRYIEAFHSAEDNGSSERQFYSVTRKKIPDIVWRLYESTATGQITDTKAGIEFFKSPKMVFLMAVIALSLGAVFFMGKPKFMSAPEVKDGQLPSHNKKGDNLDIKKNSIQTHNNVNTPMGRGQNIKTVFKPDAIKHPLSDWSLYIDGSGSYGSNAYYFFNVEKDDRSFRVSMTDLTDAGYRVFPRGRCLITLYYQGKEVGFITCGAKRDVVMGPRANTAGYPVSPIFTHSRDVQPRPEPVFQSPDGG